jgi:conjugal transfer/entry exclusion protein
MSGVDDDLRSYITGQVVERNHPSQLAQIEQAENAIEVLQAATEVAHNMVRHTAEIPNNVVLKGFVETAVEPRRAAIDDSVSRTLAE